MLLDVSDYWDKWISPAVKHFTGKNPAMPEGALLVLAIFASLGSAMLAYHELYQQKVALDVRLAPNILIDPNPGLQEWSIPLAARRFKATI